MVPVITIVYGRFELTVNSDPSSFVAMFANMFIPPTGVPTTGGLAIGLGAVERSAFVAIFESMRLPV